VPAKAPLPKETIFKRNQVAADRRRAERKEQHKEKEIAKRDRNDNRIKRRNEDPTKIRRCRGRGVGTSQAWRFIGAAYLGRPFLRRVGQQR
jgi:hypothetical protein